MGIKTEKFGQSTKSFEELKEIEKRLEAMVERSQGAIARQKDWRYKTTSQHELYKELLDKDGKLDLDNSDRNQTLSNIKKLQKILKGKGATLKGTKEIIKNREASFIGKAVNAGINPYKAAKIAKSKQFYDFLHSDEYKKLSKSVGKAGSPVIMAEYMKHEESAVEYFLDLITQKEKDMEEIAFKELRVPTEAWLK